MWCRLFIMVGILGFHVIVSDFMLITFVSGGRKIVWWYGFVVYVLFHAVLGWIRMLEFFKTSTFKTILFWDRILCLSSLWCHASGSFRDFPWLIFSRIGLVFFFFFHLLSVLRGWFILHQAFVNPFYVSMVFSNLKNKRKRLRWGVICIIWMT